MRIIEQKTVGKRGPEACEDGIEINGNFAAVVDGSTSKTRFSVCPGVSNGRYCMQLVRGCISRLPREASFSYFCSAVTDAVNEAYRRSGVSVTHLEEHPEDRLTASAVVYSDYRKEVWMVGDCQCIANGRLYENPKPHEERLAAKRAQWLHAALARGLSIQEVQRSDPGRAQIIDELRASCRSQNKLFAVIDGFPIYIEGTKTITVDDTTHDVVLASDGYPVLRPTLEDSEAMLDKQLHADPLCISRFKATKGLMLGSASFDDRSYVRLAP